MICSRCEGTGKEQCGYPSCMVAPIDCAFGQICDTGTGQHDCPECKGTGEMPEFEISLLIQMKHEKNDIRTFYGDYDDFKDKGFTGAAVILDRFVKFNTGPLKGQCLKANTQVDIDWIEIQMAAKEVNRLEIKDVMERSNHGC